MTAVPNWPVDLFHANMQEHRLRHQQAEQIAEVRLWLSCHDGTLEDLERKFRGMAADALNKAETHYSTEPVSTNNPRWITPI